MSESESPAEVEPSAELETKDASDATLETWGDAALVAAGAGACAANSAPVAAGAEAAAPGTPPSADADGPAETAEATLPDGADAGPSK